MNHNTTEHLEQSALIEWANLAEKKYPELKNLFAIPNGGKLPYVKIHKGKIWSPQRMKLVKEGLKQGVPDLFLAYPSKDFHGLFIEMKHGKNKCTTEQENWLERLFTAGYLTAICYSFESARDTIMDYLNWKYDK